MLGSLGVELDRAVSIELLDLAEKPAAEGPDDTDLQAMLSRLDPEAEEGRVRLPLHVPQGAIAAAQALADGMQDEPGARRGSLPKSAIAGTIRRYYNRIKYCYQKQLVHDPGLAGGFEVQFSIMGDGKAQGATITETTMNNRTVEDCVCAVINQLRFPEPEGGGKVVVRFPFKFRSVE